MPRFRVRATRLGWYGESRKRTGDEFEVVVASKKDLGKWMEVVAEVKDGPDKKPE